MAMKRGSLTINRVITWIILIALLIFVLMFVNDKFGTLKDMFLEFFK